jgi:hypothetical protein
VTAGAKIGSVTRSSREPAADAPIGGGAYGYYCRRCGSELFRVSWYLSPQAPDGSPRPPGWAIECGGCGRVTLIPEVPEFAEVSARPTAKAGS